MRAPPSPPPPAFAVIIPAIVIDALSITTSPPAPPPPPPAWTCPPLAPAPAARIFPEDDTTIADDAVTYNAPPLAPLPPACPPQPPRRYVIAATIEPGVPGGAVAPLMLMSVLPVPPAPP